MIWKKNFLEAKKSRAWYVPAAGGGCAPRTTTCAFSAVRAADECAYISNSREQFGGSLPRAKQSRVLYGTVIRGDHDGTRGCKDACFPFCLPVFVSAEIHDSLFAVLTPVIFVMKYDIQPFHNGVTRTRKATPAAAML